MASFYIILEIDNIEEDACREDITQQLVTSLKDEYKYIDVNLVDVNEE